MTERQRSPILKPNKFYTFGSYFQMKFAPADILRELGVTLTKTRINLPIAAFELLTRLPDLRQRLKYLLLKLVDDFQRFLVILYFSLLFKDICGLLEVTNCPFVISQFSADNTPVAVG